jgi:hypothetical protein
MGQPGESGVSSDGKVRERDVDIRGSKVAASAYVEWEPFVVDPWTSIWLCTDRMSDLWGLVNRRSSMIIVVRRYPNIPLEMSIGTVYVPPTDSPAMWYHVVPHPKILNFGMWLKFPKF